MSLWSRIANTFRGDRLNREIEEELASHLAEGSEQGRDPSEIRKAFGSALRAREQSRDIRLIPWLDSLRADMVFGCRQLMKRKVTSAAAVLSLALAIGSCTSAFRLIDALLLRPLPVKNPEQLYDLTRHFIGLDGKPASYDEWAYPSFRRMRAAVKDEAELIAISETLLVDLTYKSDQEMEKANLNYVSGWIFDSFGLRPALGRLFTENDDLTPDAHPYAVLSHDYWARRFARDPNIIGRTFRLGDQVYQIIGVAQKPFTGISPGAVTDIFLPTMMSGKTDRNDQTWMRTIVRAKPGIAIGALQAKLNAISHAFEEERAKHFIGMNKTQIGRFLAESVILEPAAAGASSMQGDYRRSLMALGVLVALVLLIACANVANRMTAQASARAREMALRVSIGAGRWRLLQLVLVESACLALLASAIGGLFAWWAAPSVVRMISAPGNPVRLMLPVDWRVFAFGLLLTAAVVLLFGLAPALRASVVKPASALKGGEDPHARRRLMHALIASQVAFCFLILFVAGLFVVTFDRLSTRPMGFSADRLLVLNHSVASSAVCRLGAGHRPSARDSGSPKNRPRRMGYIHGQLDEQFHIAARRASRSCAYLFSECLARLERNYEAEADSRARFSSGRPDSGRSHRERDVRQRILQRRESRWQILPENARNNPLSDRRIGGRCAIPPHPRTNSSSSLRAVSSSGFHRRFAELWERELYHSHRQRESFRPCSDHAAGDSARTF
jgi:hypothetical protein